MDTLFGIPRLKNDQRDGGMGGTLNKGGVTCCVTVARNKQRNGNNSGHKTTTFNWWRFGLQLFLTIWEVHLKELSEMPWSYDEQIRTY